MLRVQKLHLQETLIPYPCLRRGLKHQHLRITSTFSIISTVKCSYILSE